MRIIYAILLIIVIVSCNSNSSPIAANDSAFKTVVPRTPVIDADNYVGTLPCADCEGIDVTLQLKHDSTYIMNSVYKGNQSDSVNNHFINNGKWSENGNMIILSAKNSQTKYLKSGNELTQLDGNGNKITGPLTDKFILHKK